MFTKLSDIDRLFGNVSLLRNRLNTLYKDFESSPEFVYQWGAEGGLPKTNLYRNGDHFEIWVEVPGLNKEDLNVKIQGNYLEISGSYTATIPEGYKINKIERSTDSFTRSFTLPSDVDATKVEATLKDGILYMILPKSEAAKPKKITIS